MRMDITIMAWDSRLDEMFKDLDNILQPDHRCDLDVIYATFKKVRDLLKKIAEVVNDPPA